MSEVWKYFIKLEDHHVKCKICKSMLKYNKSTSNMWNHLKGKHTLVTAVTKSTLAISEMNPQPGTSQGQSQDILADSPGPYTYASGTPDTDDGDR